MDGGGLSEGPGVRKGRAGPRNGDHRGVGPMGVWGGVGPRVCGGVGLKGVWWGRAKGCGMG